MRAFIKRAGPESFSKHFLVLFVKSREYYHQHQADDLQNRPKGKSRCETSTTDQDLGSH